jgi:hypothetical protein
LKRYKRNLSWFDLSGIQGFAWGYEEKQEKKLSEYPVSQIRFERHTSICR